jgi:hypothetical protein
MIQPLLRPIRPVLPGGGALPQAALFDLRLLEVERQVIPLPNLIYIKTTLFSAAVNFAMDWQPINTAPFDRDLELAVLERDEVCALIFPSRRTLDGWINAETKQRIEVQPTHWRVWESRS